MEQKPFKAFVVEEHQGEFVRKVQTRSIDDLPNNDLLINVHYSPLAAPYSKI